MPTRKKHPHIVAVQLDDQEKRELKRAADHLGMALSVWLRAAGLEKARREAAKDATRVA